VNAVASRLDFPVRTAIRIFVARRGGLAAWWEEKCGSHLANPCIALGALFEGIKHRRRIALPVTSLCISVAIIAAMVGIAVLAG
jgi:hypothetical protein